jgi:hypothetical protein
LTGLVKKMDERLARAEGKTPEPLGVFVIFDSTSETLENELRTLAKREGVWNVTLSIGAAPPRYQVNAAADVTVVIYAAARRGQPVTANFALRQEDLDDAKIEAIVKALSDVLPK